MLWHLYKSLLPSTKGLSFTLCNFYFEFESPSSLIKAPTRRQYDRTWVLGVANMRVCFMNGSMFEHDGIGITYFSIDILKDMVACWYAWVFKLSCQNKTISLNNIKFQMSILWRKEIWYNMLGSIPHQKFCFYHLPNRGRAGIKFGDADMSPTYL